MSKKIKISSDSTCDLSPELIEQYDIAITPLTINIGDRAGKDGVSIFADDVVNAFEQEKTLATTSAISIGEYMDHFKYWTGQGYHVIHVNISAEFSCCHQNAVNAAAEVGEVTVIDSRNLSSGQGHIVLAAAEMAGQGKAPAEIAETMADLAARVDASFLLDTLTYMHKGGRCSAVQALGANLLQLKPCIEVKNGKMGVGKKYRGNLQKCYKQYLEDRMQEVETLARARVFITHSPCRQDIIDLAQEKLAALDYFDIITETAAGSTITSHCGPNTLGILYIHK